MTLKNTDKFYVRVSNHQTIDNTVERITEEGAGSFRTDGKEAYIKYKTDDATIMIKLEGLSVNVKRIGTYNSDTDYVEGKRTSLAYNTPYGTIDMHIDTKSVKSIISQDGGNILMEYDLYAGGDKIANKMEIAIEAVKGNG